MVYAVFDENGKCLAYAYNRPALLELGYELKEIEEVTEKEFWEGWE